LRDRGSPAALPRRQLAALASKLSDRPRDARPPDASAAPAPSRATPARPLPARRAADGARRVGLVPGNLPAAAPPDARGARRPRRGLPPLRRGHRPRLPSAPLRLGALVRARGGRHPPPPGPDRPALPHQAHDLALAQHPPLRAQTPREPAVALEA